MRISNFTEYTNENIYRKFLQKYRINLSEAQQIFHDTLLWLFMCAHQLDKRNKGELVNFIPSIEDEIHVIDLMWHEFILFTSEYKEFCENHAGFFIHHQPLSFKDRAEQKRMSISSRVKFLSEQKLKKEAQCHFIVEHFGKAVLYRWYIEYPRKYSRKRMMKLLKS